MHTHSPPFGMSSTWLVRPREIAQEKAVVGWIRIACFLAILFHHTVIVPFEFVEGRALIAWLDTLRDFGVVGFFLVAGGSLRAKTRANPRMRFTASALAKVMGAALAVTAFMSAWQFLRGVDAPPFWEHFYRNLYSSNLWFLLAYALAGPLLIALDERAAAFTFACGLVLVIFPAYEIQSSPYVLHAIALAFVCMYVGYHTYGWQIRPRIAVALAASCLVARTWLDDFGTPVYPAIDAVLRLVYGLATVHVLMAAGDRLVRRVRAPRFSNYLFVPYVVQYPLISVMEQVLKLAYMLVFGTFQTLVFATFTETVFRMAMLFILVAAASFAIAVVLRRHDIRL
ncbi:MAG: hypothetical protein RJA99_2803 [Pseudomonadota bacterium]|jgi:hypothetical protein